MTKTLPQMLNDLLGLSALLVEQAAQVQELVSFFGGVAGVPAPLAVPAFPSFYPIAAPLPSQTTATGDTPINELTGAPVGAKRGRPPGVKNGEGQGNRSKRSRALTKEDKEAIRTDWASFLPHQRTTVNRLALAAKYQVTGQHVFALTRSDPPLKRYFERAGGTPAQILGQYVPAPAQISPGQYVPAPAQISPGQLTSPLGTPPRR